MVAALRNGGYRNHCPRCLSSTHVDVRPGDRAARCGGLMRAVALDRHSAKGFMVVHRCGVCGHTGRNRAAEDDSLEALIELMRNG